MYQLAFPAAELAPYIESYWCVHATADVPLDLTVDVFVDLRADLVFTFGAPYERGVAGGERESIGRSNLDAQRSHPIQITQRGEVSLVGVRFHAGGLSPFVVGPVQTWNDRVVDLAEVFSDDARTLEDKLRAAGSEMGRHADNLNAFFASRLRISESYRVFQSLKEHLHAVPGDARMDELCARRGVSQRQLDRLFRAHLGFSPKTYARVVRFQRALNQLKKDPGCTLADIAARCGYYDQSHFVREFRAYAGTAPKARVGYFPAGAPADFAPNVVQFVQDRGSK